MRPYRKEKVASVVRQVVSEAIVHRLHDPRVEPLTSVTRVELSSDLLVANVFLSIHGDDATERRTLTALRHAAGFIQRTLASTLSLRQCPELRFDIDEQTKGVQRTLALLEENRRLDPELFETEDQESPDVDNETQSPQPPSASESPED